jgi:hypothetical protein
MSRRAYDFTVKHVVLTTAAASLPSLWFSIITIWGRQAGFFSDGGPALQTWVLTLFWVAIATSASFSLLRAIGDKYNTIAKSNGIAVLSKLMSSANTSKSDQYDKLSALILDETGNQFCQKMSPAQRTTFILNTFQRSLSEIFGLQPSQIGLSVLYKFNTRGKWHLIRTNNLENDLTVEELTTNDHTTAMSLFRLNRATIFHADKQFGKDRGTYVVGPKDAKEKIGSVLCHDISISSDVRYVMAVLSITTYGNQLCEEGDTEAKDKIVNFIIPSLENRIKVELATMYMSDSKRCAAVV